MINPDALKLYWYPQLHCECGWVMRHVTTDYDRRAAEAVPLGHGLFECANPIHPGSMVIRVIVELPPANIIIRQS